jgi:uncharacterized protein involved in outer membrane biogenesis
LRIGLTASAVLVIGLVVAAAAFIYTADYSRYRERIEKVVTDATGRQLEVKGDVGIKLSLPPELNLSDVTLANAPWGSRPQMVHIGQLRVRIRLIPLLLRQIDVAEIRLIDTDLLLETDANGQANWQFDHKAGRHPGGGMRSLALKHLEIERLDVTLRSAKSGASPAHYQLDRLDMRRSSASDSLAVELQGRFNAKNVELSGQTGPVRDLFAGTRFPLELSGDLAGATVRLHGELDNAMTLAGLNLTVETSGSDLATFGEGIGVRIPHTDSFEVRARLAGNADRLAVQDANVSVSYKSIELALNGAIAGLKRLEGIDLNLKGSGNDLADLSPIIDKTLPETGPFAVSGRLTGAAKALALSKAQGTISRESIKLSMTGNIGDLITLEDIDLDLKGSGNDLAELSPIIDKTLPETGPFAVSGRLTGTAKVPAVSEARGTLSQQSIKLSVRGRVNDLIALRGINLNVEGTGNNLGELSGMVGNKLPDTGPFSATARLTGSAQELAAADLDATLKHGAAKLAVSGKIGNVRQLSGIQLDVQGSGQNVNQLSSLFDTQLPDLGFFTIKGKLSGSPELLELDNFSASVDHSDLAGWAKVELGKRPKVTTRLQSGLVDFTRILEQVQGGSRTEKDSPEKREASGFRHTLFSHKSLPFDVLHAVDADVTFKARNIRARDAALEFGQLALRLEAGDLQVEKLEATYEGTKVSANLNLAAGTPASVAMRFLVQGFDLGRFLKETHVSQEVEGQVDLAADLRSQGNSPHRLMANLDGTIGAVIGKGYVPRFLDLLAQDLSRRVISIWGRHKKAGHLNCGVVQFTNKDGIGTSDAFLFDTQIAILKGDGEINFATEQLDFVLSPKPKDYSLFSLATKLRVTGSILDPKVRPDMRSVATKGAKALSSLVLGPAGLLLPFMNAGARNQHPCDIRALKSRIHSIYE